MLNKFRIDGDTAFLVITRRKSPSLECPVDVCDIPRLEEFGRRWSVMWSEAGNTFYVYCLKPDKRGPIYLHRWLMNTPDDMETDHFDHNGLNNRCTSNLRNVNHSRNQLHRRMQKNNSSGYRGVNYDRSRSLYTARVKLNRKNIFLGRFKTAVQAHAVVSAYRINVLGCVA